MFFCIIFLSGTYTLSLPTLLPMKGIRTKLNRVHDGGTFRMVTVSSVISRSPNKIGFIIPSMNHKIKINGNYTDEYFGHTDQTVKKKKSKLFKKMNE